MSTTFKVNDWCFCEFTLQQIKEIEGGRITSVSDGFCSLGSYSLNDRCFPLDMDIKRASNEVEYWSKKFLNISGINHPDLNRKLISFWVDMCKNKDDKEALKTLYEKLNDFGQRVLRKCENMKNELVDDVNIFR